MNNGWLDYDEGGDPVHSRWRVNLDGDHWHLIAVWPALSRQQVIDAWRALDAEPALPLPLLTALSL